MVEQEPGTTATADHDRPPAAPGDNGMAAADNAATTPRSPITAGPQATVDPPVMSAAADNQPDAPIDIVVIDDEPGVLQMVLDVLKVAGYAARAANRGIAGLELVQEKMPDLIICDINMPDIDGYDVLQALQANAKTATIPLIFLTALDAHEDMRAGMNLGADDYLTKPFNPKDLLQAIESRIQKRARVVDHYEHTLSLLRHNIIYALPHELRTPLTKIMGYAHVLQDGAEFYPPAQVADLANTIERAGRRLHRLVENYLVYAQLELLATDPTQVAGLRHHITTETDLIIARASEDRTHINLRYDDLVLETVPQPLLMADDSLRKLVEELVDNACKFSQAGTPIHVTSQQVENTFVLTVQDRGHGMTADQIAQIGAYMQFDRKLREQQGIGLGLAICQRVVELHGGRLHLESEPDSGTTVTVTLPLS